MQRSCGGAFLSFLYFTLGKHGYHTPVGLLVYATLLTREQCPGWHMGWCFGWVVFPVIFRSRGYVRFRGGGGERESRCGAVDLRSNAERRGVEQEAEGNMGEEKTVS